MMGDSKRGVYCLANDECLEWFQCFVRSFRHYNQTLPLTVIPYDHRLANLKALSREFDFKIMPEIECKHFDDLESKIMRVGNCAPMFRKWASFFGPYEEFMFFDSDIAITMDLNPIFDAFSSSGYDFLYFDAAIQVVYAKEWIPEMERKYGSRGFNAGAFVGRKGAICESELEQMADLAYSNRYKLKIDQVDQPFLNFVADTKPLKIEHVNYLLPDLTKKPWARIPFHLDPDLGSAIDESGKKMPFIHWAGCHYPTMVKPKAFLYFRTIGTNCLEKYKIIISLYIKRIKRIMKYYANRRSLG